MEGGLNWPLSPQARPLHNSASLGRKVMLQTGPTGDSGVCSVCVRVCLLEKEKKMTDTGSEGAR